MTAPGTFSNKTSAAGHHLVLTGDNGEEVVTSENHPHARGSKESLEVIVRTVLVATDEVLPGPPDSELEVVVQAVTDHLWEQQ